METGQRKDAQGQTIPRKILNKFTCTVAGKQVFAADFEPAVSANPYIQFKFKATGVGPGGADLDRRRW
jgi:sulfur-oxidizing protein SoxZ